MRDTHRTSCSDSPVSWTYDILPGLPGTGPYPEQFSTHGGTHREGFVVRFTAPTGESWVGNFQPYFDTYLSGVFRHPGGVTFVVVAGGQGYEVEPSSRRLLEVLGPGLCAAAQDEARLALATDIEVIVLERDSRWVSERIAWDGTGELKIEGERLIGLGRDALLDDWRTIELDLKSHAVLRSAYEFQAVRPSLGWRARFRAALARLVSRR